MDNDFLDNAKQNPSSEDEKLKAGAKKGVGITVSLVLLGFTGWNDLEPRNFIYRLKCLIMINVLKTHYSVFSLRFQ